MNEPSTATGSALPKVSVIIPTYNRCEVGRVTLMHLLAQDYPDDRLEILVADNSADGTPAMVRELAADSAVRIRLLFGDERLPAVKRNDALRAATGDLALFMNDDVWVGPDFVRRHVEAHARHDGPVAVIGRVEQSTLMPDDPFINWYRPFAYDEIADRAGQAVSYRYHWSMNLSLPRRTMLDRNLVFHQDWAHIGHEDVELGYRWTRAGYPVVYEPAAFGQHFHPHGLASACRLQESIGRGLRDLEVLIPEPDLLERYGVLSRTASRRGRIRMTVRNAMFNRVTVPPLRWALRDGSALADTRFARWAFWKIMLHSTERGYRSEPRRSPSPTMTRPAPIPTADPAAAVVGHVSADPTRPWAGEPV
ncbi:glycosyltransferase [Nakamurella leprariae]|uniref:Glycosyltransferase family 2 protein n=1 Tax=Nakamurella leprariae TaxID=2803911 RepID=A0A939C389_9ACTN|nr:glycosyltransferase family 2 protein [Nakamurella leprariae]MBM9469149.1 glycosyltransferase family 2 protein [Nakamurella leprariae]